MTSPTDKVQGTFEDAVLRELRFSSLDKENLSELVSIVAGIQKSGLRRIKVFPKGIVNPDSLHVSGIVEASEVSKILEVILKSPRLGEVFINPYGVIASEAFQVNINLGTTTGIGTITRS